MATEENFPSFARDIQPLSQVWQPWASSGMRSTGKKDATRWRLTSLGIPTILMVLDAARGVVSRCRRVHAGCGVSGTGRKTPGSPFDFILVG